MPPLPPTPPRCRHHRCPSCRRRCPRRLSPAAWQGLSPTGICPILPVLPTAAATAPCAAGAAPDDAPGGVPAALAEEVPTTAAAPPAPATPLSLLPWAGLTPSPPSGYAETINSGATQRQWATLRGIKMAPLLRQWQLQRRPDGGQGHKGRWQTPTPDLLPSPPPPQPPPQQPLL